MAEKGGGLVWCLMPGIAMYHENPECIFFIFSSVLRETSLVFAYLNVEVDLVFLSKGKRGNSLVRIARCEFNTKRMRRESKQKLKGKERKQKGKKNPERYK